MIGANLDPLRESDSVVEGLSQCIEAKQSLDLVPRFVVRLVSEGLWRVREPRKMPGQRREFADFATFCRERPPMGLGCEPRTLENLCRDDAEATRLLREVLTNPVGRPEKANNVSNNGEGVTHGNSRSYTLDRLHREAPELYARVEAGEMSANAAAVQAGFRTRTVSVPLDPERAARTLRRHLSSEELDALIRHLTS